MISCLICGVDVKSAIFARCVDEAKFANIPLVPIERKTVHVWVERNEPTAAYGVSPAAPTTI